ncbi:hypothetical protein BAMA_03870 [Bacillus manliponensis]|uniref:Uncharacterized protein n=1 Tax=Bacillus manliponensis TaxID=574376 RepID=A0A073K8Q2_9BACI|nr:hypothetical protein [Bacillus manliponensis]KEK18653.1 hypothetical protein BAMA_03870 [Bacillus manliponensis]
MLAPNYIVTTWRKFDSFPMETLTKAWFYQKGTTKKQRSVSLMKEHREEYGITGNCFDLAIWLLDEFKNDGITAYPIGRHLHTERAHVAVITLDEKGRRYLCDLGDQWLDPILIDSNSEDYTDEILSGFFPAAKVQVKSTEHDAHWEFCNWESFLSTSEGLFRDEDLLTIEDWANRIHRKTSYQKQLLTDALQLYMTKS